MQNMWEKVRKWKGKNVKKFFIQEDASFKLQFHRGKSKVNISDLSYVKTEKDKRIS